MKVVRILLRIECRFARNLVTLGGPLSQIDQFAALAAKRFPFLIVLPGNVLAASRAVNRGDHNYIAQQLSPKATGSWTCCGR